MSLLPSSSAFCENLVLFYQIERCHIQENSNVDEKITSHKMQEIPLHDNISCTKDSKRSVWHVKKQNVVCLQFGKHTVTQGDVDHYLLLCVIADKNL